MARRYIMAAILIEDAGPETRRREVELEDQIRDRLTCAPLMVEGDRIDVEEVEIQAVRPADDEGRVCWPGKRQDVASSLFDMGVAMNRAAASAPAGVAL